MKTAFIFPAFVTEYLGNELDILDELSAQLPKYLTKASELTGDDYENFSPDNPEFIEHELRSQIISYTIGCCLSDALAAKKLLPDIMAGYSMGFYAALYTGKAIGFEEGIRLIKQAYLFARKVTEGIKTGMGSVIGLTAAEIQHIINDHQLKVDIANINSLHAHLVSGRLEDLKELLSLAEETGALHVTRLLVETPYHSPLLADTQEVFGQYIKEHIAVGKSEYPLVSAIDQRIFSTSDEIIKELTNNLFQKLNWQATFETILEKNVHQFVECGAGKSLHNISRFVSGDFKVYPMNKVKKLLAE
jgi:[acyl-carrier-protein] S-malonyltransferase